MANDRASRPFILQWRSAVLNSTQPATVKLCLLTLAEWADADGGNCFPAIPSIASRASVNEKTVRRSLDQAEGGGFIRRSYRIQRGVTNGWRQYMYQPILPEGADTVPARSLEVVDTESACSPATSGHCVPNVRTLSPERPGTESTDLSITYPLPREKQKHDQQEQDAKPADLFTADRFHEFWTQYPRKVGKAKAAQVWKSKHLDKIAAEVLVDVTARVADPKQWRDPEFIPHPTTYLNERRWEDEWKPAGTANAPRTADDFRTTVYVGSPLEDIPESLRPAANE